MALTNSKELCNLLHECLFNLPYSPHEVARKIGKPYSTLMRELNPNDCSAKLGIDTFFKILVLSKEIAPLEYMAKQLGYTLVRIE